VEEDDIEDSVPEVRSAVGLGDTADDVELSVTDTYGYPSKTGCCRPALTVLRFS